MSLFKSKSITISGLCIISLSLIGCQHYQTSSYHAGTSAKYPKNVAFIPDASPEGLITVTATELGGDQRQRGLANSYSLDLNEYQTASGESYDPLGMTAAHNSLPLSSYVKVTNLDTDKEIIVKINDRAPHSGKELLQLSYAAAYKLGIYAGGNANVEITPVGVSSNTKPTQTSLTALAPSPTTNHVTQENLSRDSKLARAQESSNDVYTLRVASGSAHNSLKTAQTTDKTELTATALIASATRTPATKLATNATRTAQATRTTGVPRAAEVAQTAEVTDIAEVAQTTETRQVAEESQTTQTTNAAQTSQPTIATRAAAATRTTIATRTATSASKAAAPQRNNSSEIKTDHSIYLQIGAFRDKDNAQALINNSNSLAQHNRTELKIYESLSGNKPMYKVRFGPFASLEKAKELELEIATQNIDSLTLVN